MASGGRRGSGRRLAAAGAVLAIGLAACRQAGAPGPGTGAPGAGAATAVASVYPLAWLAEQVAPGAAVSLLNAGGLEAHDLELTPGQRRAIETADVVLFVGDIGYQPQVEDAVRSATGEVVSLAEVAGPDRLLAPPTEVRSEEGSEPPAGAGGAVDPHLWFDAGVMADAALRTGEAFAASDPERAATYLENARALRAALGELEADLEETLGGPCRHREAIVSHPAYRYLLEPFGVEQHGVTAVDASGGGSSAALARLVDEIERKGFEHVLTEPVEGREGAATVAREAGVELLEISPLDAVDPEQARVGFTTLVRDQAAQFATALGC